MTYAGVVALPALCRAIVTGLDSYSMAFVTVRCLTLWRSSVLMQLRRCQLDACCTLRQFRQVCESS